MPGNRLNALTPEMLSQLRHGIEKESLRVATDGRLAETPHPAALVGDQVLVAHVGDTRLYRLRRDDLRQLSEDHTVAAELARIGQLAPEAVRSHRMANVLTRCVRGEAPDAAIIGHVAETPAGSVLGRTAFGSTRVIDVLVGDPLPRIC